MASFAERLDELFRTVRDGSGRPYSAREVAKDLGKSHTHVNNLRSGKVEPRIGEVERLARFFRVTVDYLLGGGTTDPVPAAERPHDAFEAALRQPGVQRVAMRMVEQQLSVEGAETILRIIDEVARLENGRRDPNRATG
ncbi:helix-turn-helix domain-containing protein [Dactylosporangium sp. NPDC000521]|uniref:helix-turn-helix domain-containing protein n=1 Tax=Dactylosporangium sp. NPDC000521 TaxID=3363975 RepID=UPI003684C3FF